MTSEITNMSSAVGPSVTADRCADVNSPASQFCPSVLKLVPTQLTQPERILDEKAQRILGVSFTDHTGREWPLSEPRALEHQRRQVKNVRGVKGLEILSAHTCWSVFPGGRSDVR